METFLVIFIFLRAPVGGETERVEEEGHMVMLGRILDLSRAHYKVSGHQEGDNDGGGGGGVGVVGGSGVGGGVGGGW